ncbi:efflux RND transporter permease subunit [Salinisphaera hydrothermalis]|uniref:Efflux pump membrane transporter n=1 Tax=Salinisphaera hydrothermalis (strain C41B8) TaxID=1304275 RepID=A0A084IR38_SALHC|nr:multidrug efflux RND transporter permease subunit [Salinisphaera hydrothermalis]KEZ79172.1 hydrophobe/amphiphile efflux-1 (HAE1) family protein [Salinisphaera hydrothermalis C41B8]
MLSKFFIDRPVFATVLSIVITLSGVLAMRSLPISQYPDVVPPEVVVRANYPGASAEDIATTVAAPLETEINGVQDMIYMTSTSSDAGQMQLNVSFKVGTDPELATINVNNRVQSALSQLPDTVQQTGVTVRKQSTSILQVFTLYSPDQSFDETFISNYMLVNVIDPLKRVAGVGDARLFSQQDYSMRIWLDPAKMARYGITTEDVKNAISEQNSQFAAGSFGARPYADGADIAFTYTASTAGRFSNPKQFKNIILRSTDDGRVLHLKDVARIELGPQSYSTEQSFNGKPAVPAAVYLQPGANALATAQRVRDKLQQIGENLPQGLKYDIPFNTTKFVQASIDEVIFTFFISLLLVIAVIFLFLQNFWATLIPLLAVPVAVVGAFAGIYLLGFSINLLTLFGMILAIGLVVDDAIIVIENIERIMTEEKAPPRQAAIKAMEEVSGPVIAVVLALNAVFVPVGFLGGLSGQMYSQFAITIAVSVVISGFVALTLTPALSALFLKPSKEKKNVFFRTFNRGFDKAANAYLWGVNFLLKRAALGVLLFLGVIASTWLVSTQVSSGLVPQEDQGYIFAVYQLPPGASLQRTGKVSQQLHDNVSGLSGIESMVSVPGYDFLANSPRTWAGIAFLTLKDWGDRDATSFDLVNQVFGIGAKMSDAQILAFNPPPIIGLSTTGGFEGYLQDRKGADYNELYQKAQKLVAAANKRPELQRVRTTLSTDVPRYKLTVDREKAKELGVPIKSLFDTLQSTFGQLYVNQFSFLGRNWQVRLQADAQYRMHPDDLRQVFVKSDKTGDMIPVSSLTSVKRTSSADVVQRFNVFPAAKIMGSPAPGYSSGQANAAIQQVAQKTLGSNFQFEFTGTAYQAEHVGSSAVIALVFGVVMVFLILAAQYEKWSLPLAVITAVPFAALGAYLSVWLRGIDNNIYFTVGLLVLIGLAAKNAILIVEFAVLERGTGKSPADAAYSAAKLRFRPIVMTSLTFILACMPLALASGAAANSRIAIGTAVIGGMLAATLFAILFVPLAYDLIERGSDKLARMRGKRSGDDDEKPDALERRDETNDGNDHDA